MAEVFLSLAATYGMVTILVLLLVLLGGPTVANPPKPRPKRKPREVVPLADKRHELRNEDVSAARRGFFR